MNFGCCVLFIILCKICCFGGGFFILIFCVGGLLCVRWFLFYLYRQCVVGYNRFLAIWIQNYTIKIIHRPENRLRVFIAYNYVFFRCVKFIKNAENWAQGAFCKNRNWYPVGLILPNFCGFAGCFVLW